MQLRFMKRSLTTAALVVSAGFLVSTAFAASADDMQKLLKEGVELLQRGRADEANAKFRAVLAADPSSEDAYNLVKSTDHRLFLEMLKAGGSSEQVAARLLELSHQSETAKSQDQDAIRALVQKAVGDSDFGHRSSAVNQLVASHGEYAVPQLAAYLGSNDIDTRANAIIALTRLGPDAVAPLAASLGSGSEMQQRNTAELLARMGDERAVPALLRAAAGKGAAAESAAAAAAKLGGSGNAADAYLALAKAYFHGDPQMLRNYDGTFTVWRTDDGKLHGVDVPGFLYNFELAEQACYDGMGVQGASAETAAKLQSMVAMLSFAELAAWNNLSAEAQGAESMAATRAALDGARALASASGASGLLKALHMATEMQAGQTAALICDAIADLGDGGDIAKGNSLTAALTNGDKTIRYAAALALLRLDPKASFPTSNLVAKLAGDAASEAAIQQVLVIDSDTKNGMNTQRALNGAGFHAVAADSGAGGLLLAKQTGGFDAIVVRDHLGDMSTFKVLDELRRDFRTATVKTVVMAGGADLGAAGGDFQSRGISGVAPTSDDAKGIVDAVKKALGDATDANAAAANAISIAASHAVAGVRGSAFNLADAQGGLLSALRDGAADDVRLAALGALANMANADAAGTLTGVLARSENSAEIRAGAAKALGTALRGHAPSDAAFEALVAAMGDASVPVRSAAGAALGAAKLSDAQRAKVLKAHRVE